MVEYPQYTISDIYKCHNFNSQLPSLELRRLHADLVMCYKIVFGLVKLSFTDIFAFRPVTVTRGHQYKLYVNHSRGLNVALMLSILENF